LWTTICPISGSSSSSAYCQPATFAVSVYWKFMQRAAPCLSLILQWRELLGGYFCKLCLLKVHVEISYFPLPPSLVHSKHPTLSAACVLLSSLFIIQLFLWGGSQSVQGALLVYPRGGCGSTACCLFSYPLVCISQAGLELVSGGTGVLLFSQCNVAWKSFVWAGDSSCQSFVILHGFFLPSVAPVSQQDFWFTELKLSASSL
jgi:hypothetical protein